MRTRRPVMGKLALQLLPKVMLTRLMGAISRSGISRWFIPLYIRHYGIDPRNAEKPWQDYRSLVDFFSRRLKVGERPAPVEQDLVLSPVDGIVQEIGKITDGKALQVKGVWFSLEELLTERATMFDGGDFVTLYLGPKDYHRIHIPLTAKVSRVFRVTGSYYPVNSRGVSAIHGLYTKNERVVAILQTPKGEYAMVPVGATIVGCIKWHECNGFTQGDEFGWFEMGSTVILMFPPGMVTLTVQKGERMRANAPLGTQK